MGRPPCCDNGVGVKKGPWTPEEDIILVSYIQQHGPGNWRSVPENTGLMRCSKSCRLRWTNYLRPGIKRGNFTPHEEGIIIHLQAMLGNKWAAIASYLPQRTDNDIKNYWNTHLKKKVKRLQAQPDHSFQTTTTAPNVAASPNYYNPSSTHQSLDATPLPAMAPYPSSSNTCGAIAASNEASTISKLFQTWGKPSPAAAASYKAMPAMQELQSDDQDGASVSIITNCRDHIAVNGGRPSSETVAAPAVGHGEVDHSSTTTSAAATFSLLENWLLDDMPGQAAMDGFMEISAGCCADPIMF